MPTTGEVQSYANDTAIQQGIDPATFLALINKESGFQTNKVGSSGEQGPGQLMPRTSASLGVNPLDWRQNIQGSAAYFASMLTKSGGDVPLALAGYNAGPGVITGSKAIPGSTQDYVSSILKSIPSFGGVASSIDQFMSWPFKPMGKATVDTAKKAGNILDFLNNLFTIQTGTRLVGLVVGVIFITIAIAVLAGGTKFVQSTVKVASKAALAA